MTGASRSGGARPPPLRGRVGERGGGIGSPRVNPTAVSGILDHPHADDDDRGCGASRGRRPTSCINCHNPTVKQPAASRSLAATAFRSRRLFRARFDPRCPALFDRGRRECRMRVAPVAACAEKKHRRQQPGVHRISRHSLHNGVTAYTRSPRGPGFLAPVTCGSYPQA
jgi:hypothetical protein